MLTKAQVKACLAGEPTPVVPARLFWFDGKFVEANQAEVARMHERHTDDFVHGWLHLEKRGVDGELDPGEFADEWGCLFRAAPDGVGAHPTRAIVSTVGNWEHYVADSLPDVDSPVFTAGLRKDVTANPDKYVVAPFWRTFYERMYMLMGFEDRAIASKRPGSEPSAGNRDPSRSGVVWF